MSLHTNEATRTFEFDTANDLYSRTMGYSGIGRRLLMIDELPEAVLPQYESDARQTAFVVPREEPNAQDDATIAFSTPEYVGAFPIRQDVTVLPADEPRTLREGIVIREEIGSVIINQAALDILSINRLGPLFHILGTNIPLEPNDNKGDSPFKIYGIKGKYS